MIEDMTEAAMTTWAANRYRLTATINDLDTANNIETFFIERATQLLKSGSIASIIMLASILSNGGSI